MVASHLRGGILPFIPVVIGIGLKFSLLDKPANSEIAAHFFEFYLRPAWIEFIVVAYITGLAGMMNSGNWSRVDLWLLVAFPAFCFVICLILIFGTVKIGIENDWLQVYVPAFIAASSLAISGGRIGSSI